MLNGKEKMMREYNAHFLTVLGTGSYNDCVYEWGEGKEERLETKFAQMATLKKITESTSQNIKITVFLTKDAREKNWEEFKKELEKTYPNSEIVDASIKEGRNLTELNEIFAVMYDCISENEVIYFDFTHGLRNIPIQALTVANHARVEKNVEIGGLYYGAFELGVDMVDEDGNKIKIGVNESTRKDIYLRRVPLMDISFCDSILHWTSAAESFITSGSSNLISKTFEEESKKEYKEDKNVEAVVSDLYDLTNCLETSRGKYNEAYKNRSIRKAYEVFKDDFDKMKQATESGSDKQVLIRLFAKIEKELAGFENQLYVGKEQKVLKDTSIGLAAVKWAIHKNLTQQGYTALQETIITYVGERYNCEYDRHYLRENIKKLLVAMGKTNSKEEAWNYYGNKNSKSKKLHTVMKEIPKEVADCFEELREKRNSLNHFGYQNGEGDKIPSYNDLQSNFKRIYNHFLEVVALDCIGKNEHGEKVDINSWKE